MLPRICLCVVALMALPVWSQTEGPEGASLPMMVPPPMSHQAYSSAVGSEERSNYLMIGLVAGGGYVQNLYAGEGTAPINDTLFLLSPTISFDQTTSRSHRMFTYAPGFSFYQPTSVLNETDENATVGYQFQVSPHTTLQLDDAFDKSSTGFSQPYAGVGGSVSGSLPTATPLVLAPFGDRLMNAADGAFTWQYGRNSMIGLGGNTSLLDYPNPSQTPGLYNSHSNGASAFYTSRISGSQYLGATYQYAWIVTDIPGGQDVTNAHTVIASYTYYAKPTLSFSVAGGPQYIQISEAPQPGYDAWAPAVTASMSWQGLHTAFAASYARTVTAGAGLLGAFQSDTANATARWRMSRTWTVGAGASYSTSKTVSGALSSLTEGHAIAGNVSVQHSLGQQLSAMFEYDRVHESYAGIAALSNDPNTTREMVTVSWHLSRPLGR